MKQIDLLLIGDIHYPELVKHRFLDQKDEGVSDRLISTVAPNPLQIVMRDLSSRCKDISKIQGLLFCGDLTSWGKIDGYAECVAYLHRNLDLQDRSRWALEQLHAVPGNHDVDRNSINHESDDIFAKFESIGKIWAATDTPILATRGLRNTTLKVGDSTIGLFSLNSCLGCGEKRYLPPRIRDSIHQIFREVSENDEQMQAFSLIGEQLDTPAFAHDHVIALAEAIESAPPNMLPIVLGHHNILAQALLRVDLYTEVINAGMVRTRLSTCHRPTLYCHGHIHSDPIEIIRTPDPRHGPLISISAPRLDCGFLRLGLSFSSTNEPIGCTVVPYRFSPDGSVKVEITESQRISFRSPRDASKGDPRIREYVNLVPSDYQRFPLILEKVRQSSHKQTPERTVAEILLEAEWYGLLEILDRHEVPRFWQLRRLV